MRGHLWTLLPHLGHKISPPRSPGQAWTTELRDEQTGAIRLHGLLHELPGADSIVIIVHGMAGNAEKGYVVQAAEAARRLGLSSLRITLRGSGESGQDIYHAGLVEDLQAAIDSPEVRRYRCIHLLGFSLGGHMVTRYALQPGPKVRSAAALCAPLDLDMACRHIDRPSQAIYRQHLLSGLRRNARAVEARHGQRFWNASLGSIRKIREWDDKVLAPRFGFRDAADYYRQMSAGPHLDSLAIPTLIVSAAQDPMVAEADLQPSLAKANANATVRSLPGGHVHFASSTIVLNDAMRWLRRYR